MVRAFAAICGTKKNHVFLEQLHKLLSVEMVGSISEYGQRIAVTKRLRINNNGKTWQQICWKNRLSKWEKLKSEFSLVFVFEFY